MFLRSLMYEVLLKFSAIIVLIFEVQRRLDWEDYIGLQWERWWMIENGERSRMKDRLRRSKQRSYLELRLFLIASASIRLHRLNASAHAICPCQVRFTTASSGRTSCVLRMTESAFDPNLKKYSSTSSYWKYPRICNTVRQGKATLIKFCTWYVFYFIINFLKP